MNKHTRKMIAGLGNPGEIYKHTRHNAGFLLLDCIAKELDVRLDAKVEKKNDYDMIQTSLSFYKKPQKNSQTQTDTGGRESQEQLETIEVILIRPKKYMNLSGEAIAQALDDFQIKTKELMVLHDEIDLAFGRIHFKKGGGHRGHNGLRNIISLVGADFDRLRLGVDHPGDKELVTHHVLSAFSETEREKLPEILAEARDICLAWLKDEA